MVARFPSAIRRTFTVLQLARLADRVATLTGDDPVELGRTLVQESLLARSDVRPGRRSEEDIADPIGRSLAFVRRRAADIERAIDAIFAPPVVRSPSSRWAAQTAITRRAALSDRAALPITRGPNNTTGPLHEPHHTSWRSSDVRRIHYGLTLRQLWISPQRQLIEPVDAPRAPASAELAFGCSVEP